MVVFDCEEERNTSMPCITRCWRQQPERCTEGKRCCIRTKPARSAAINLAGTAWPDCWARAFRQEQPATLRGKPTALYEQPLGRTAHGTPRSVPRRSRTDAEEEPRAARMREGAAPLLCPRHLRTLIAGAESEGGPRHVARGPGRPRPRSPPLPTAPRRPAGAPREVMPEERRMSAGLPRCAVPAAAGAAARPGARGEEAEAARGSCHSASPPSVTPNLPASDWLPLATAPCSPTSYWSSSENSLRSANQSAMPAQPPPPASPAHCQLLSGRPRSARSSVRLSRAGGDAGIRRLCPHRVTPEHSQNVWAFAMTWRYA